MKIPSFPATDTRTQQPGSAQNTPKPKTPAAQDVEAARAVTVESLSALRFAGPSSASEQKGVPGMDMGMLNSMMERSLKMLEIHNDPSIPPEQKKKLLQPLEAANKNALEITTAKLEEEEKEKIIEESSENADAIREAGEEIAESADANAPVTTGEVAGTDQTTASGAAPQKPAAAPESSSPVYSASPSSSSSSSAGENVDTHA